ncbi:Rib/alpha-like domain-containing protein [uncultured Corynebacterium sp.]|uniref:Rib/alpha-like domain-containing protein n=1 Tax=uncultured Corynebacterium sp. TaxID=159447 RepID=UPI002621F29E|nr:Rib/alpha-like domain-containing protein [uncultured Corynebacterium sp.]
MVSRVARSALAVLTTCALCAPTSVAFTATASEEPSGGTDILLEQTGTFAYPLFASYSPEFGNWLYLIRSEVERGIGFRPPVYAKFSPEYQLIDPPEGITYKKVDGPEWLDVDPDTGRVSVTNDLLEYKKLRYSKKAVPEKLYTLTVDVDFPDGKTWTQYISVALFNNWTSYLLYNNPATLEEPRFPRRPLHLTPGQTLTLTREDISWKDPQVTCGDKPGAEDVKCIEREIPGFWPNGVWDADLTVEPQPHVDNPLLDYVTTEVITDDEGEFQELKIHAHKELEELNIQGYHGGNVPIRFRWSPREGQQFTWSEGDVWDVVPLYVFFNRLPDNDNYVVRPAERISTVTGRAAAIPLPTFDSAGIDGLPEQPVDPEFSVLDGDGATYTDWISVDAASGQLVARPRTAEHLGGHEVPMQVTFQDGTVSPEFHVPVHVAPLASTAQPAWANAQVARGTTRLEVPQSGTLLDGAQVTARTDAEGFAAVARPDGAIEVTAPAHAPVGTTATFTVTTRYPDSTEAVPESIDTDEFTVTVVAPEGDTVDAVRYPAQELTRGESLTVPAPQVRNVTFAPATDADGTPTPEWAQVSPDGTVVLTPSAKLPRGEATVPVRAEDGRGDVRIVEIPVTLRTVSERFNPSWAATSAPWGEQLTVRNSGDAIDAVVEASLLDAPSWHTAVNGDTVEVTPGPDAKPGDTARLRITATYSDESTDTQVVTVRMRSLAESLAVNWEDVAGPRGHLLRAANTGDPLPEGTAISVSGPSEWGIALIDGTGTITLTPPENAKVDEHAAVQLSLWFPDGSHADAEFNAKVTPGEAPQSTSSAPAPSTETGTETSTVPTAVPPATPTVATSAATSATTSAPSATVSTSATTATPTAAPQPTTAAPTTPSAPTAPTEAPTTQATQTTQTTQPTQTTQVQTPLPAVPGEGSSGASISRGLALAVSPLMLLIPIALAQQTAVPGLTPALEQLDAQLRALPPEAVRPLDQALAGSGFNLGGAAAAGAVVTSSIVALSIVLAAGQAQGQIGSTAAE